MIRQITAQTAVMIPAARQKIRHLLLIQELPLTVQPLLTVLQQIPAVPNLPSNPDKRKNTGTIVPVFLR